MRVRPALLVASTVALGACGGSAEPRVETAGIFRVPDGGSVVVRRDTSEWDHVAKRLPTPLPPPLDQPAGCRLGINVVLTLADGSERSYGPCARPPSIERVRAAIYDLRIYQD